MDPTNAPAHIPVPTHSMLIQTTFMDKTLPIPSPGIYQDMCYPPLPFYRPILQRNKFPTYDYTSLPRPRGNYPVQEYNLLGLPIYQSVHVRNKPTKIFTRWLDWYLEINDSLLSHICPADLNDLPCPWDEVQGGCPMLRLCVSKRKFQHPHLGFYPECVGEERNVCLFIHDVETTCWSLHDQLVRAPSRQFRSYQTCPVVARQTEEELRDVSSYCKHGHDLEGARVEAWWNYWEHKVQATRCGARGVITQDRFGRSVRTPVRPKRQTLEGTSQARNLDGSLSGRTWHGSWVTLTCMVGTDKPVDDWVRGQDMVVDWERSELRPLREVRRTPKPLATRPSVDINEQEQEQNSEDKWSTPKIRRCQTI